MLPAQAKRSIRENPEKDAQVAAHDALVAARACLGAYRGRTPLEPMITASSSIIRYSGSGIAITLATELRSKLIQRYASGSVDQADVTPVMEKMLKCLDAEILKLAFTIKDR